ncbi:aldo/keto reductase [Acidiferrobacter sp.]|uniref:aldo/keto reductase n=1 Tax=Acidiferrobacter sp. TaxID=1872107 RepID=UPI00345B6A4E
MRIHHLPGTDLAVSDIGLGTMTFGEQTDKASAHEELDYALAEGINLFDMAEMYPVPGRAATQGATETIVGAWLAHQARDRVVIATKVAGPLRGFHWLRGGPLALDLANMREALEGSLKRLKTDYVDLYQIHWPARPLPIFGETRYEARDTTDAAAAIEEQLQALATLVREGKVRYIGLSNETPWGAMRFLEAAERLGLPRIVTIQNAYNLLNRTFESGLAEVCHRERLGLLAYSPLAFGLLTGKYQAHSDPQARLNRFPEFGPRYRKAAINPALEAYAQVAERFGISLTALALAFVRSRFFTASTLLGARTLTQLKEDLNDAKVVLPPEALAAIEEVHLRSPNPAP